jgi:hypothetical protein
MNKTPEPNAELKKLLDEAVNAIICPPIEGGKVGAPIGRVENRRSGVSLPVATDEVSHLRLLRAMTHLSFGACKLFSNSLALA